MAPSENNAWSDSPRTAILIGIAVSLVASFVTWVIFAESWKSGLVNTLVIALIYALPMIFLAAFLMPAITKRINRFPAPWDWVAFFLFLTAVSVVTITVSSGLMVLARLVSPENPWPELRLINRLAFTSCLIFAGGARLVGVTRARLEQRNRVLEEKIEAHTRERNLQSQEMEHAWEIQQALFPKHLPRFAECCIAAGCQPARVVGGDYFDVIQLGENRVAVAIADVVGKGMAAALLMSNLQAIVRAFVPTGISPAELCTKANEVISGNIAPGKFVSFFCAIVDTERMTIEYCNAGHNPPFLVGTNDRAERLTEGGPLLGIFHDARYVAATIPLQSDDALVLFTDGITEATNASGDEFGEARLIDAVRRAEAEVSDGNDRAKAIRKAIESSVYDFAGSALQDDATLVILTTTSSRASAARA